MCIFLNLGAMKHIFAYKLTTLVLVMVAIASVAARAQESANGEKAESAEEITNFDDVFAEETSTNESAPAEQSAAKSGSSGVTVLDEMGIEGEGINEAAPVDKKTKAESVKVMDATELQGSSATIADATNRSSGVKIRQSGGIASRFTRAMCLNASQPMAWAA